MMETLMNELTFEMIPETYQPIAETIGVENLLKLAQIVGGTTFYMPKAESFVRPARDKRIKAEFTGYNLKELAHKYGVSERWVQTALSKN